MKKALTIAGVLVLLDVTPAIAHRLDEYLQAATILVSSDRVRLELRLSPGVAVAHTVVDSIDTDRDHAISDAELSHYAERVLADLSLAVDGANVPLRMVTQRSASVADLAEGVGVMNLTFEGAVPAGRGVRRLVFENHHRPRMAAYLVNGLVPEDRNIQLATQQRSSNQSRYELTYGQGVRAVSVAQLLRWLVVIAGIAIVAFRAVVAIRRHIRATSLVSPKAAV